KKQEDLLDNLNVLYVALTRAEEQLHIISSYKIANNGNLSNNLGSFFVEYLNQIGEFDENEYDYDFGSIIRVSKFKNDALKPPKVIEAVEKSIDTSVIKIAKREAIMWDSSQQKAIEKGNIIHQLLSNIYSEKDIETEVKKAVLQGLIADSEKIEIQDRIKDIVHHPELKDFFNQAFVIYTERPILHKTFKNLVPDRVVLNKNEAFLIDYKTGVENDKYIKQ